MKIKICLRSICMLAVLLFTGIVRVDAASRPLDLAQISTGAQLLNVIQHSLCGFALSNLSADAQTAAINYMKPGSIAQTITMDPMDLIDAVQGVSSDDAAKGEAAGVIATKNMPNLIEFCLNQNILVDSFTIKNDCINLANQAPGKKIPEVLKNQSQKDFYLTMFTTLIASLKEGLNIENNTDDGLSDGDDYDPEDLL